MDGYSKDNQSICCFVINQKVPNIPELKCEAIVIFVTIMTQSNE